MKKLVMAAAVYHKDSVFNPEECFDYQGKTYERLDEEYRKEVQNNFPDRDRLSTEELQQAMDEAKLIKYRYVIGPDDYDYVGVGAHLPTKEKVEEMNAILDLVVRHYEQVKKYVALGFVSTVTTKGMSPLLDGSGMTEHGGELFLRNDGTWWGDSNGESPAELEGTCLVKMDFPQGDTIVGVYPLIERFKE